MRVEFSLASQLIWCIARLAQSQSVALDQVRLQAAISKCGEELGEISVLRALCAALELPAATVLNEPDPAYLPLIAYSSEHGWGLVTDSTPDNQWTFEQEGNASTVSGQSLNAHIARIDMRSDLESRPEQFAQILKKSFAEFRGVLLEAVVASVVIGLLALGSSLFSMQVYDRVIPNRSEKTLVVLSLGVTLTILFELAMKYARSHIMDAVVVGLDKRLTSDIFRRLLSIRMDQLPGSVGSLASQLRGYEQIRSFYTASTLFNLVDLPFGVLFLLLIAIIGSPLVALVPMLFSVLAIALGFLARHRINRLAAQGAQMSNLKTGLLVETVEGMETIKAGSGGWKFLSRWITINSLTIQNDVKMRASTDGLGYLTGTMQQLSYACLVVAGSYVVMQGQMTMGALIACSILSGRVLSPVMAIPGLLVQHAHARAAMQGLEKLYELETDENGVGRPLAPARVKGQLSLDQVKFSYGEGPLAVQIGRLQISAGQRVGILGPIGSGKSTMLRLLSGLYKPQSGRIFLDGLDLAQISRHTLSRQVGYLQQDHRLFQGTLRENLLIGLPDPGDDAIQEALRRSGLDRLVSGHPKGLELPIFEGGKGLSGGQRQLVAFTRLLLWSPSILLLDEPTASMDSEQERKCLAVLSEETASGKTLVVVTHKPAVLALVDRVLVVVGNQVVLDGPRDEIIARLQAADEGKPISLVARRNEQAATAA